MNVHLAGILQTNIRRRKLNTAIVAVKTHGQLQKHILLILIKKIHSVFDLYDKISYKSI